MNITDDRIAELKKEHGKIFLTTIKLPRQLDYREIKFIYREPTIQDCIRCLRVGANNAMLEDIIVYPDREEVLRVLESVPIACANFIMQDILPRINCLVADVKALNEAARIYTEEVRQGTT